METQIKKMKKHIVIIALIVIVLVTSWLIVSATSQGILYNIDSQNNGVMAACPNGQVMMASSTASAGVICVDPSTVMPGNNSTAAYDSGTAYSLTATPALLDFGTTDPSVTLGTAGTYLIAGRVRLDYNAATFLASRTITLKLRRTNNTAADITNSPSSYKAQVVTLLSSSSGFYDVQPVIYTTTSTTDVIQMWGSISVVPTAGSLDAVEGYITAIRLY